MKSYTTLKGKGWDIYGKSNAVLLSSNEKKVIVPGHDGEVVPGFIDEDLLPAIEQICGNRSKFFPITAEIDPTWVCHSKNNCGSHCFSAEYRKNNPVSIPINMLRKFISEFHLNGGKIIRWDGGGEPLLYPEIRNGNIVKEVNELGIKQTLLTSGHLLDKTKIEAFIESNLYLRISLNAATEITHTRFHNINDYSLQRIINSIEFYINLQHRKGNNIPVGVTFLLSHMNYTEVVTCAKLCKQIGIRHFSARKILGPNYLRPDYTNINKEKLEELLLEVKSLEDHQFITFLPKYSIHEADFKAEHIDSSICWQSIFKIFIEPSLSGDNITQSLCGRYRGGGIGQLKQINPFVFDIADNLRYRTIYNKFFSLYDRTELVKTCPSCIDKGFITLVNNLVKAMQYLDTWNYNFDYIFISGKKELKYLEF